jgi:hypothetical protein
MLNVNKVLLLTLIGSLPFLTGCSHDNHVKDCYTINQQEYCRELGDEEEFKECVDIQQAIFRGFERELPAHCYKYENMYGMTHVIERKK